MWRTVYSVPSSPPPSPVNHMPFNDRLNSDPLSLLESTCKCAFGRERLANIYPDDLFRIRSIPMALNKASSLNRLLLESGSQSRTESSSLEFEALAAVHQLSFAVQSISVSEMLPRTPELIFVNVTTLEGQPYCLELTNKGWRVTSLRSDCMQGDFTRMELFTKYYENIFDLMEVISPGYKQKFNERLTQRLRLLEDGESGEFAAESSSFMNSQGQVIGGGSSSCLSSGSSLIDSP